MRQQGKERIFEKKILVERKNAGMYFCSLRRRSIAARRLVKISTFAFFNLPHGCGNKAKIEFLKKILVETKNTGCIFGFLHMKIFAEIDFSCLFVFDNCFFVAFDQNLAGAYDVCA